MTLTASSASLTAPAVVSTCHMLQPHPKSIQGAVLVLTFVQMQGRHCFWLRAVEVSCVVAALTSAWGCSARLLTLLCVSPCACSALHFVAAIGNAKCVKLLIDAGADINLQDKEGECQHRQV